MHKKVQRLYKREGNSEKFRQKKREFKKAVFLLQKNFFAENISKLRNQDPKRWHAEISRLARNGGRREDDQNLAVPGYAGMSDKTMANTVSPALK